MKCLPWIGMIQNDSKPQNILTGLPGSGGVLGAGAVPGVGGGAGGM